jgi:transposase InsO family protein
MYYKRMANKTSESVAKAFHSAIRQCGAPAVTSRDNGGEFVGEKFQTEMQNNQIKHWRTKPYKPQQNGNRKILVYYRILRNGMSSKEQIDTIIAEYNKHRIHSVLQCTPAQERQRLGDW